MPDKPVSLLLTRPHDSSGGFAQALRDAGAADFAETISPAIGIVFADNLPETGPVAGLILTSAQAARAWQALGGRCDLPAHAVGDATAAAARAAGLDAQSAGGDADALVARLLALRPPGPLLHLRGAHARGDIAARLTAAGLPTREAQIYDQPEQPPTQAALRLLARPGPVVAPVFSPRSAAILGGWLRKYPCRATLLVAAMSEAVAFALPNDHIQSLTVASRPDSSAMLAATVELLGRAQGLPGRAG